MVADYKNSQIHVKDVIVYCMFGNVFLVHEQWLSDVLFPPVSTCSFSFEIQIDLILKQKTEN